MEGWIKLHRKLAINKMWLHDEFTRGQAWVDLLMLANHEDGFIRVRGHRIEIKRGQVGWSQESLAKRWKWSRKKVSNFLQELQEMEQQIEQQKNNFSSIITIVNYDLYQQKEQQNEPLEHSKRTAKEQQKNTNKNDKNVKNVKNNIYTPEFEEFWNAYPKKSGSKSNAFNNWKKLNGDKPDIETILAAIKAQVEWRENARDGDFRPEWKDPERWIKGRMWEVELATEDFDLQKWAKKRQAEMEAEENDS